MSPGATVRLPTAGGRVTLRVVRFAYPFVEGIPQPDSSEVVFPARHASAEVRTTGPDGAYRLKLYPDAVVVPPQELVDRDVQFSTPEGTRLALHVRASEEGLVHGLPIACWGDAGVRCTATILVDLSETTSIRVRGVAWGGVTGNLLLVGLAVLVGVILEGLAHFDIE
jgi:hypothetical protein